MFITIFSNVIDVPTTLELLTFLDTHHHRNGVTRLSAVLFVTMTKRAVGCTQDTLSWAGFSCNLIVEQTSIPENLGACHNRTATDVRGFALADGNRCLGISKIVAPSPWNMCNTNGTRRRRSPRDCADDRASSTLSSQWLCSNLSCEATVVEIFYAIWYCN